MNLEVVVTLGRTDPPQLHYADAASRAAVVEGRLFEQHHAVRDALQVHIGVGRGVVEHEHGAVPCPEVIFQREYLPAMPQRIAREHPHLRE